MKKEISKVLIVDDEVIFSRVLEEVLSDDHEIVSVDSAQQALELLNNGERFSVIISDIMMPEMDGMDLFRQIQQIDPEQATRVVFMSGGDPTPTITGFLKNLKNKKISKPFRLKELRSVMHALESP